MRKIDEFLLSYWSSVSPEKEAVYDGRYRMTYAELEQESVKLAVFLSRKGISVADRVMVCLPNCCEMLVLFFAAEKNGNILVPVNFLSKDHDIEHALAIANPRIAFVASKTHSEIIRRCSPDTEIIVLDVDGPNSAFSTLTTCGNNITAHLPKASDPLLLVYTSGSTGKPKGVLLSRSNLYIPASDISQRFRMDEQDVVFVPVPICHMLGIMGMITAMQNGAKLVLMRKFAASAAFEILAHEKVSIQFCVPTIYEREIEFYECLAEKPQLPRLRTGMIAGAPSIRHCIEWFEDKLGCKLLNSYGMTEASALAMADIDDPRALRQFRCGRACEHTQISVIKDDGRIALPNEPGEIICKGPNVMLGYYGQAEETAGHTIFDGWFKTGDIGQYDNDGVFSITGRKKDIIIRGGYNVAPLELEDLYNSSGLVSEVCAVGYPDAELGERIALFVVLKADVTLSPEALRSYAADNLAKFKIPDKVILMETFPRLPNGKTDRKALRQQACFDKNFPTQTEKPL